MRLSLLCLFSLFTFFSCGKKEELDRVKRQELRLNIHSEPPSLDVRKATDVTSISILKMCFEGLTRIDMTGHPVPALAERIEISEDQKRYTFYLRDAQWSDGTPVTAYDFEKTWKTMLDPLFPCEFATDLYLLKNGQSAKTKRCSVDEVGVKALDDKTLQVDLEYPAPFFLAQTANHSFFATATHITDHYPDWADHSGKHFVSNGPFRMKEWRHSHLIVVEKNPFYWDRERVKLEKISLTLIEDESTELSMFEQGELDWAGSPLSALPIDAMRSLKQSGNVHTYPVSGTYYYIFNTKRFPFNNVNFRRALALAINRRAIIENITQAGQTPAMALIPPTMWKEVGYFKDDDISQAKQLFQKALDEMGIKVSDLPELTLSYNTSSAHHKIAQAIQEQWHHAFGIRVKLENKEWKVFLDELRHQQFQIARMGGVASINDPSDFLNLYKYLSSSNNHAQWTNPRFTELLDQADLTTSQEKRFELMRAAEKIMINEMPIIPIYFYTGSYLKKPYVKGVYLSELSDVDLKLAYLEQDG